MVSPNSSAGCSGWGTSAEAGAQVNGCAPGKEKPLPAGWTRHDSCRGAGLGALFLPEICRAAAGGGDEFSAFPSGRSIGRVSRIRVWVLTQALNT